MTSDQGGGGTGFDATPGLRYTKRMLVAMHVSRVKECERLEDLLVQKEAEIERLKEELARTWRGWAVVEAARAYVARTEAEAAATEPWNAPEIDNGIRTALTALEESA